MSKIGAKILAVDEQNEGAFMRAMQEGDYDKARDLFFQRTTDEELAAAHRAWLKERREVLSELAELAVYDKAKANHAIEFIMKGEV